MESGIPFGWVTGDEVYGQAGRIRLWPEEHGIAHVLAVPKSQMVMNMEFFGQARAHELISELPERVDVPELRRRCSRPAQVRLGSSRDPALTARAGWVHWLLARLSLADPMEIASCICFCPAETPLEELVRIAGSRWMIEECFQTAKNEAGLDHYQVRGYKAWYRHITLSMAALAFLAILREEAKRGI
ncbi:IS701 family transposase [Embleya sp. NPDC001921]